MCDIIYLEFINILNLNHMKRLVLFLSLVIVIVFFEIHWPSKNWRLVFWIFFAPGAFYFWNQDIKEIDKARVVKKKPHCK
jgi:hypothetical protein